MILLINTKIEETRRGGNRLDVFKYSLASLAALHKHWSKVIIYCDLGNYAQHWSALEVYIKSLFKNIPLVLQRKKIDDWETLYEQHIKNHSDNLIWLQKNHDQIFIDYNLRLLDGIIQEMYLHRKTFISCIYSHWPEFLRISAQCGARKGKYAAIFLFKGSKVDQIINKSLFAHWIFKKTSVQSVCYVPYRELARRFDGYGKIIFMPRICPPLRIPPNFFQKEIRIHYCGRKPANKNWLYIHPLVSCYNVNKNGPDCHYTLNDMPLFWKRYIKEIKVAEKVSEDRLRKARYNERIRFFDPHKRLRGKRIKVIPWIWAKPWLR